MTELTEILRQEEPISPEQVTRIIASWTALPTSPIATDEQCDEIANALAVVGEQARPAWIMARVAALLSQYYAADVPAAAVSMMAEDWLEELREYPQWAITNAVRWWKSADNPDRKKRPLEGDIAARCKHEMGVVSYADFAVRRYWGGFRPGQAQMVADPVEPELTPEERAESRKRVAEIVAAAGFSKRVGGAA